MQSTLSKILNYELLGADAPKFSYLKCWMVVEDPNLTQMHASVHYLVAFI